MKIILSDLTMTKVYVYKPIEDKTVVNAYINNSGSIVSKDSARMFDYDVSAFKSIKVVSESNGNLAPYARFVNASGTMVGTVITYPKNTETEYVVPTGATKFQINDTWDTSSQVSVYGKKG